MTRFTRTCKVAHMGNLPAEDDLLTTAQVAELTGWPVTTINRWAAAGTLPSVRKLPGRTGPWLFDRAVIEAFRQQREQVPA